MSTHDDVITAVKALAEQMNRNFGALASRLEALESKVDSIVSEVGGNPDGESTQRAVILVSPDADVTVESALDAVTSVFEQTDGLEWSIARDAKGFVVSFGAWWVAFEKTSLSLLDTLADSRRMAETFAADHPQSEAIANCATRYVIRTRDDDERFDTEYGIIRDAINRLTGSFCFDCGAAKFL